MDEETTLLVENVAQTLYWDVLLSGHLSKEELLAELEKLWMELGA